MLFYLLNRSTSKAFTLNLSASSTPFSLLDYLAIWDHGVPSRLHAKYGATDDTDDAKHGLTVSYGTDDGSEHDATASTYGAATAYAAYISHERSVITTATSSSCHSATYVISAGLYAASGKPSVNYYFWNFFFLNVEF